MADVLEVIDQVTIIESVEGGVGTELLDQAVVVEVSESGVIVEQPQEAIDHGGLTGLGDDDHPQYLDTTRGDARYDALGAGAGAAAAAVAAHAGAADPHAQYLTAPEGLAAGILSDLPAKLRDKKFIALDLINGVAATGDDAGNATLSTVEAIASTLSVPAGAQSYDRKRKIVAGLANKLRYHHTFDGTPLGVLIEPATNYLNRQTQPTVAQAASSAAVTDTAAPSGWSGNWLLFGDNSTLRALYNTTASVIAGQIYGCSAVVVMDDGSAPVPAWGSGGDFELRFPGGPTGQNPDTGATGFKVDGPFASNIYIVHSYHTAAADLTQNWGGVLKRTTHSAKGFRVGPVITYAGRYPPSLFDNATVTPNSRAADVFKVPLSGFDFGGGLTLAIDFVFNDATAVNAYYAMAFLNANARLQIFKGGSNSLSFVYFDGVSSHGLVVIGLVSGQRYRACVAMDSVSGEVRAKVQGLPALAPYTSLPKNTSGAAIRLSIGSYDGVSSFVSSPIAAVHLIDRAWSAAEIAEWTDGYAAKAHTHPQADITNLPADLAAKAPLASPGFTGTPTAPTAAPGTNTTQISTTAFVAAAIAALANAAPATLDTLKELADALGSDPNFATTMTNALAGKAPLVHTHAGLAPAGGAAGQVLKKIDGTDHNYSWQADDTGGASTQEVYVQQTRPVAAGPWVWWQTDGAGAIVDLTVNDGL